MTGRLLLNNERYKKAEFADLCGYWLNIDTINAMFNQKELAAIVAGIVLKHIADFFQTDIPFFLIANSECIFGLFNGFLALLFFP